MVRFSFGLIHLIVNTVDERMLEDIKYTNAMKVLFQISAVHIREECLQIFRDQEPIKYTNNFEKFYPSRSLTADVEQIVPLIKPSLLSREKTLKMSSKCLAIANITS